jgi:tRNA nucleotidyltransferase (CCA-adding enzyme)
MEMVNKMSTIKGARRVLFELKKNGYEAFIVGGAVRDHLLGMPLTDIDITTNAKPHQVSKLFKTKPTGLKYGTVTVFYNNETFEVTTYRVDGPYLDNRHPEDVIFSDSVIEDVKRRDFTINGILMSESLEIIDHVEGTQDLKNKIIKTIGNPLDRFNEDALRIMRAFYFQSKLGFQIDRETREAISSLKHLLSEIAMERILTEMIKILKGPQVKKAIHSMVTTGVSEVLPGLSKGLNYCLTMESMPFVDVFFILSFVLHGSIPKEWPFSNKHRNRYEIAAFLVNQNKYDAYTLYTYGLELSLLANRVSFLLKRSKNLKNTIEEMYESLPIQSDLDLKLRAPEMIQITGKKAGAWVKEIQTEMVIEIINHRLKNEKEALISYLIKRFKE